MCEKLKELVAVKVLPDVKVMIDELFAQIAETKSADDETKGAYAEFNELREELEALLDELNVGALESGECAEIYEELKELADGDV